MLCYSCKDFDELCRELKLARPRGSSRRKGVLIGNLLGGAHFLRAATWAGLGCTLHDDDEEEDEYDEGRWW